MENETKQEHIELYLAGTLTGQELIDFEKLLQEDKVFAKDFEIMKDVEEAFNDVPYEKALTEQLETFGNKYMPDEAKATTSRLKPWMVGAMLLALSLVGGSLIWNYNTSDKEQSVQEEQQEIFASNMEVYSSKGLRTRSSDDENELSEEYQNAIDLYDEGDFEGAIPVLKNHLSINPSDTPAYVLLGNCYLKTEPIQLNKAIETFEEALINGKNSVYASPAQWYLALAYLKIIKGKKLKIF